MKTLELPALMDNLDEFLDFVITGIHQAISDKKNLFQIRLVCEEIIVNVIHYAYPDGEGNVAVSYDISPDQGLLTITIADRGVPFNPLEKDDPDISLPLDERPIGGLGIFMVKSIMDEVRYQRENDMNTLTLTKSF
jgi:anti-sigma regulatory factor (Ser/Thr protein kinase)